MLITLTFYQHFTKYKDEEIMKTSMNFWWNFDRKERKKLNENKFALVPKTKCAKMALP